MGWITKNSATEQIPRRDEPYLTDEMKQRLEEEVVKWYPQRRAAIMATCHAIQEAQGWIPHQALEEVAEFLDLSFAEVMDTVTFYEEYFLRPKGKYVIWVCQSIACELLGHDQLLEHARQKLNIDVGETTEDGKFTLMTVECLGSCGTAPVALVDERLHENLTVENFDQILDGLN
jgi:NADH-quinone oxidoreductase subunit E